MLIVGLDEEQVERDLLSGRLACPACRSPLSPWGSARPRVIRLAAGPRTLCPRRSRCRSCDTTHVLLPSLCLARRRDAAAVIGAVIEAKVAGAGHRPIAKRLGLPSDTVRGWLRRFRARAGDIRMHFTRWAAALDPELGPITPGGGEVADALEAIAIAVRGRVLRFGPGAVWAIASELSGGLLLANTSCPFSAVR